MKVIIRTLSIINLVFIIVINNASAGSVAGFGGSTEITQLANNVQLVQSAIEQAMQTQHQLNMYMAMVENMKNIASADFSNPQTALMNLHGLLQQVIGISHQMGMADEYFRGLYPDYTVMMDGESYSNRHAAWTDAVVKMCEASITQADLSITNLEMDAQLLGTLAKASRTAVGQKAAIQAGNEISAQLA